ncbi:S16 family serine protease [Acidovorax sp. 106]|uniref:S16 family serine protease n=1 Tax=Acidovorax sp. 106 TaxID=2135637 RepID=UPI0026CF4796
MPSPQRRLGRACRRARSPTRHQLRHNYPEEQLHESIVEGERLITLSGSVTGQINALTQIDLGDYRFGFPVRITARTFAGQEGLLNIEREVDMSGPIHDKGVLILHSYLTALFSHVAPLALNASIVFEQEYSGVEGDSASCAELYALLSSLSGLPLRQGIAVTGALNQHGEVLPVGGINEKIEGWFRACATAGLDGTQGVLIPSRNQRHLMLPREVLEAVPHVYTVGHVSEGIALLTGEASGMAPGALPPDHASALEETVLSRAEQTLRAYRRACQSAGHTRRGRTRPAARWAHKPGAD